MARRHAYRFYLAFFALAGLSHHVQAQPNECVIRPQTIVRDACVSFSELEQLNSDISPALKDLTRADFFAYYRLNLFNKECPFWNDESSTCGNRACAVDTIDDPSKIPSIWSTEELSKLEGLRAQHPGPRQQKERPKQRPLQGQLGEKVDESCVLEDDDECDERDYCIPEDEGATSKGDYVSLLENEEKFTGYAGPGARQVWDAIYKENCFSKSVSSSSTQATSLPAAVTLRNVFQEYGRQHVDDAEDSYNLDDQCIEQRAFYRIISGMHASISTHICWDYFNQTTGEWTRNLECYKERLHTYPERVSNLYFNYALVTRAIAKLRKHLEHYTFCSGDPDQDYETKQKVQLLTNHLAGVPNTFDESALFVGGNQATLSLKDDFKQRFRNVSRIMDCVGCDKCRLWGKLQTAGYGAALKILFEFDETKNGENPHLRRTELVALINTLGRLSHSMAALQQFRKLIDLSDSPANPLTTPAAQIPVQRVSTSQSAQEAITTPSWAYGQYPDPDDSDFDDAHIRDFYAAMNKDRQASSTGIWAEIKAECNLVWRTYIMVLKSWFNLPFKLSGIFLMEVNRAWSYFLGLPVPPRSWKLRFPTKDEL